MRIKAHNSGFIGKNTVIFDSLPSTNDYLKEELAKSKPFPEGTVIMAVHQFSGKGQRGASWYSEKGLNLTFSILLCPVFLKPQEQFYLTAAISLGILAGLEEVIGVGKAIQVKWPNDIYVNDRKIAGVLIQNSIRGEQLKHSVVGIGLNVNQMQFETGDYKDSGVTGAPTSLQLLTGKEYGLESVLQLICTHIEYYYLKLKFGERAGLIKEYTDHLYRYGIKANYKINGTSAQGVILGVDLQGKLLIEVLGKVMGLGIKEVSFE